MSGFPPHLHNLRKLMLIKSGMKDGSEDSITAIVDWLDHWGIPADIVKTWLMSGMD